MKPGVLPEGDAWKGWPKVEQLQAESGLSIAKLRTKLRQVPCYRCPDKSVRYDPELARSALFDDAELSARGGGRDELDDEDLDDDDDEGRRRFSPWMLVRECMRMLSEARKDRADTIKSMQAPLDTGLLMMKEAMAIQITAGATQGKRLEHMEGMWDRMVALTEDIQSNQSERELKTKVAEHSIAVKKEMATLVKTQLPTLLDRWSLTSEAGTALSFFASLDPRIVDQVIASDVLTVEQLAQIHALRSALSARQAKQPQQEPPKSDGDGHTEN